MDLEPRGVHVKPWHMGRSNVSWRGAAAPGVLSGARQGPLSCSFSFEVRRGRSQINQLHGIGPVAEFQLKHVP